MDRILKAPAAARVIGLRQVRKAIIGNKLRCVCFAEDIDEAIKAQIIAVCDEKQVPYSLYRSRSEMGEKLGIDVACAVCGELKQQ